MVTFNSVLAGAALFYSHCEIYFVDFLINVVTKGECVFEVGHGPAISHSHLAYVGYLLVLVYQSYLDGSTVAIHLLCCAFRECPVGDLHSLLVEI